MYKRLLIALSIALLMALVALPVLAQAPIAIVNGSGWGVLTEVADPTLYQFPVKYAFAGNINADGTATGNINFVFQGEMAAYWAALPGVQTFHVFGQVTSGSVAPDGTVTIRGTITEHDFIPGEGKVFEVNDPFVLAASPGDNYFFFQYCALPDWMIVVTNGNLGVHSTTALKLPSAVAAGLAAGCGG